jgi:hypothetical protein
MAESALINLDREKSFTNSLSKFKIVVDGKEVGTIADGDSVQIPIAPGGHSLRLRSAWTGSPTVAFSLGEGETIQFTCRPALTNPMLALPVLIQSFFKRDNWVILETVR